MADVALKGGDKLEAKLKQIAKKVSKAATLRVGFLEGATHTGSDLPVATIAAIQEYGAPRAGIPARSFFRTMIAAKSDAWGNALARLLKANDYDVEAALALMGQGIEGQLRDSIIAVNDPPLSDITLMLRKMRSEGGDGFVVTGKTVGEAAARVAAGESTAGVSTKPLIDTAQMLNAISSEVDAA